MDTPPDRLVAHTPPEGSDNWHYLDDHLREVASLAASFAKPFGGENLAWWAGILHDLGKVHPEFQNYLWQNYLEPEKKHQTVDHKTAGAVKSMEIGGSSLRQIILAHHGGLADKADVTIKVRSYLAQERDRLDLSMQRFETLGLIPAAEGAHTSVSLPPWFRGDAFELEMLMRMVFSALVDADALDTEGHWQADAKAVRAQTWPELTELEARFFANQHVLTKTVEADGVAGSPVNRVRREVFEACLTGAELPPGFFRMTVPTGGGKTRSGLAFALRHAVSHQLHRVVVAVPFITITEQTADVYREAVGADALIEHHGGMEASNRKNRDDPHDAGNAEERRRRLVTQNWDAPLIITTTVQLLESLFTNRTSKARKLHNLAESVIILDEIQTLPPALRGPVFSVLYELIDHYRVTVLLSTATQPVLDTIAGELVAGGRSIVELAPDPARLFHVLKRVEYDLPCLEVRWDWQRVADTMASQPRAMTIVNTIKDAAELFATLGDPEALHLSTRMCGAHRRDVLQEVRRRLDEGRPCHLVSTQLVEAGVDLDFPLVLRALAPLDRIVQAAGRCNREGRLPEPGRVIVFRTEKDAMPPGVYRQGTDETLIMLRQTGMDMHDPDVFRQYFERLYGLTDADRYTIQALRKGLNFASVDEAFELIRDDTFPVLVNYPSVVKDAKVTDAWNRARQRLVDYRSGTGVSLRSRMRDIQPWLVNCRRHEQDRLLEKESIVEVVPGVLWEWRDSYHKRLGIKDTRLAAENLFV